MVPPKKTILGGGPICCNRRYNAERAGHRTHRTLNGICGVAAHGPALHWQLWMDQLTNPLKAAEFFRKRMSTEVEEVWVAALNAGGRVKAAQCLFRGTVDQCLAHPRDIFRFACIHNASSILVAHNHPSGPARPSAEDIEWTQRLAESSKLLMIPLADHIIVGRREHYSFLEKGVLRES